MWKGSVGGGWIVVQGTVSVTHTCQERKKASGYLFFRKKLITTLRQAQEHVNVLAQQGSVLQCKASASTMAFTVFFSRLSEMLTMS